MLFYALQKLQYILDNDVNITMIASNNYYHYPYTLRSCALRNITLLFERFPGISKHEQVLPSLFSRGSETLELCKMALKNGAKPKIAVSKTQYSETRIEMQKLAKLLQQDYPKVKLEFS